MGDICGCASLRFPPSYESKKLEKGINISNQYLATTLTENMVPIDEINNGYNEIALVSTCFRCNRCTAANQNSPTSVLLNSPNIINSKEISIESLSDDLFSSKCACRCRLTFDFKNFNKPKEIFGYLFAVGKGVLMLYGYTSKDITNKSLMDNQHNMVNLGGISTVPQRQLVRSKSARLLQRICPSPGTAIPHQSNISSSVFSSITPPFGAGLMKCARNTPPTSGGSASSSTPSVSVSTSTTRSMSSSSHNQTSHDWLRNGSNAVTAISIDSPNKADTIKETKERIDASPPLLFGDMSTPYDCPSSKVEVDGDTSSGSSSHSNAVAKQSAPSAGECLPTGQSTSPSPHLHLSLHHAVGPQQGMTGMTGMTPSSNSALQSPHYWSSITASGGSAGDISSGGSLNGSSGSSSGSGRGKMDQSHQLKLSPVERKLFMSSPIAAVTSSYISPNSANEDSRSVFPGLLAHGDDSPAFKFKTAPPSAPPSASMSPLRPHADAINMANTDSLCMSPIVDASLSVKPLATSQNSFKSLLTNKPAVFCTVHGRSQDNDRGNGNSSASGLTVGTGNGTAGGLFSSVMNAAGESLFSVAKSVDRSLSGCGPSPAANSSSYASPTGLSRSSFTPATSFVAPSASFVPVPLSPDTESGCSPILAYTLQLKGSGNLPLPCHPAVGCSSESSSAVAFGDAISCANDFSTALPNPGAGAMSVSAPAAIESDGKLDIASPVAECKTHMGVGSAEGIGITGQTGDAAKEGGASHNHFVELYNKLFVQVFSNEVIDILNGCLITGDIHPHVASKKLMKISKKQKARDIKRVASKIQKSQASNKLKDVAKRQGIVEQLRASLKKLISVRFVGKSTEKFETREQDNIESPNMAGSVANCGGTKSRSYLFSVISACVLFIALALDVAWAKDSRTKASCASVLSMPDVGRSDQAVLGVCASRVIQCLAMEDELDDSSTPGVSSLSDGDAIFLMTGKDTCAIPKQAPRSTFKDLVGLLRSAYPVDHDKDRSHVSRVFHLLEDVQGEEEAKRQEGPETKKAKLGDGNLDLAVASKGGLLAFSFSKVEDTTASSKVSVGGHDGLPKNATSEIFQTNPLKRSQSLTNSLAPHNPSSQSRNSLLSGATDRNCLRGRGMESASRLVMHSKPQIQLPTNHHIKSSKSISVPKGPSSSASMSLQARAPLASNPSSLSLNQRKLHASQVTRKLFGQSKLSDKVADTPVADMRNYKRKKAGEREGERENAISSSVSITSNMYDKKILYVASATAQSGSAVSAVRGGHEHSAEDDVVPSTPLSQRPQYGSGNSLSSSRCGAWSRSAGRIDFSEDSLSHSQTGSSDLDPSLSLPLPSSADHIAGIAERVLQGSSKQSRTQRSASGRMKM